MPKELDIVKIFPDGKWESKDEFLIACPYCGDKNGHHHCFINLKKMVFHCFLCDEKGPLRRLLREKAGLAATAGARFAPQPDRPEVKVDMTDFDKFEEIPFPRHSDFDPLSIGAKAWEYLTGRGIIEHEIIMYKMRYAKTGRYARRVIFPIIENGKVVCFSARTFANEEPKYLFPKRGETLLSAAECIFNYDDLAENQDGQTSRTVVITEGILDCIAVEGLRLQPNVVAVSTLSKRISDTQARKLISHRDNTAFVILFDSVQKDPHIMVDIAAAAAKLTSMAPDVCVSVAKLKDNDPDTADPEDVERAICEPEFFDVSAAVKINMTRPRKKISYPGERRI